MPAKDRDSTAVDRRATFCAIAVVNNANQNGNPLADNMPRVTFDGRAKMMPECIKNKINARLHEKGEDILYIANDMADDGCRSIIQRLKLDPETERYIREKNEEGIRARVLERFIDRRAFGAVIITDKEDGKGMSIGIRGAVTIGIACSIEPVSIVSDQITKCINSRDGSGKGSDTMGMRYCTEHAVILIRGSINPLIAAKNGLTWGDAYKIRDALLHLFENDDSSARPAGSMEVAELLWWDDEMLSRVPVSRIYGSVRVTRKDGVELPKTIGDYDVAVSPVNGIMPEILMP